MSELVFKGKEFVYNHHLAVPFRPLKLHPDKGIGPPSLNGNLVIHGDNLHVLKSLIPQFSNKISCVFIDPPYNTGHEGWCYNDRVNSPMLRDWFLENVGTDDGLRHDKWCAMMWPRLTLLRELMNEEGLIFVTIDDNQQPHLRLLMDEIFGKTNFISQFVVLTNPRGRSLRKDVAQMHEYVLLYARNSEFTFINKIQKTEKALNEYNHKDENGLFRLLRLRNTGIDNFNRKTRPNLYFPIFVDPRTYSTSLIQDASHSVMVLPDTDDGRHGCWTWSKSKILGSPNLIVGRKVRGGKYRIYRKDYLQGDKYSTLPKSLLLDKLFNHEVGKESLRNILPKKSVEFPYPKSPELLKALIRLSSKTGIVLDSFAGSGTTAQAVLELNHEEGSSRQFILVEMEDYADHTTAERVRRVIRGYDYVGTQKTELLRENITWTKFKNSNKLQDQVERIENQNGHEFDRISKKIDKGQLIVTGEIKVDHQTEGLGGSFTYCTLKDPINIDKMLTGKVLPSFQELGELLFHITTNEVLNIHETQEQDFYLGMNRERHVWLLYKPDLNWLKSQDAALTLTRAREFVSHDPSKHHLVFSPARFVSQKTLQEEKLLVEFIPLPLSLYRIAQD